MEARPAAGEPLEQQEHERHGHEQRRELHRGLAVEGVEPDAVDRVREGADPEQVHGAEVGERLHQGERHAAEDRRARERQADPHDRAPARHAEPAGRLEQRARLAQERRARQQVHVRVEHEREDADGAEARAHVRHVEPEREEGEDVARHRQRQHQDPLDPRAAREVAERHERRQRGSEHERAGPDPDHEDRRGLDRLGQVARELRELPGSDQEADRQAQERPGYEDSAEDRQDGGPVGPPPGGNQSHPTSSMSSRASSRCSPAPCTSIGSRLKVPKWEISAGGSTSGSAPNSKLLCANRRCCFGSVR